MSCLSFAIRCTLLSLVSFINSYILWFWNNARGFVVFNKFLNKNLLEMTRFARAKGSKSSNERAPEDSTPWEVMKEQLMQAKKDGEESKNREKVRSYFN